MRRGSLRPAVPTRTPIAIAPGEIAIGVRVGTAGRRDPLLIQVCGDGPEAHPQVAVHFEDLLDGPHSRGCAWDQLCPVALGGAQALPWWQCPEKNAFDGIDLLLPVRHEPNLLVGTSGTVVVEQVVSVRRHPAQPPPSLAQR